MRLLLLSSALTIGAGLGLAGAARAASSEGPPPPAPIFYCPAPAQPGAQPHALACPAHARVFRARHLRRMRHGLRVRVAGAERPYNPEDDGVSASQAWVYRYELARGGLHPWEVDGRWDVRPHHPLWVAPPPPAPLPPIEHHWSEADHGHAGQGADEHQVVRQDEGMERHMERHDWDQGADHADGDHHQWREHAEAADHDAASAHHHHHHHDAEVGHDQAWADEGSAYGDQAEAGDRYGEGRASHAYSYERRQYDNGGGSVEGDRNGRTYSHSWRDGGRGADVDRDGQYRQGYSERFGQADRDAAGYAHHSGGGYSYSEEGGNTGWRGGYVGEGGDYARDDQGYGPDRSGQAGDIPFGDDPDGQPAWRSNTGGGYEVYSAAGRDSQGYLVWAGKPRAPGQ